MSYPIDVLYLSAELAVLKVADRVRPWRFSIGARRTRHTLELHAGEAERLGLRRGARLTVSAAVGVTPGSAAELEAS